MDLFSGGKRDEEFTAFVTSHGASLSRTAYFLCGDVHSAQDLVQVALTKTYVAWPAARRGDPLAYARRVMVNSNIDTWRARRWRESSTADVADEDSSVPPDFTEQVGDRSSLVTALLTLTFRERSVLVLRFFEDLSERDTARALNVGGGTVKSTSSRALAKLRLHPFLHHNDDPEVSRAHH